MIIPTPEFDPFFAEDGIPFAEKMWGYIRREFADIASDDVLAESYQSTTLPSTTLKLPAPATADTKRRAA